MVALEKLNQIGEIGHIWNTSIAALPEYFLTFQQVSSSLFDTSSVFHLISSHSDAPYVQKCFAENIFF